MLVQTCNSLLRCLGVEIGIPELALDAANCSVVAFDSVVVNFELDDDSGQFFLYSNLGTVPAAGSSALYEQLLDGNLMGKGTRGATLGLDRRARRVVLHQGLPAQRLSDVEFKTAVENFVDVAEAWTQRVSEAEAAARNGDAVDEASPSSMHTPGLLA